MTSPACPMELFLSLLRLRLELVDVDLAKNAHKAPEFLCKNPLGQVRSLIWRR